MKTSRKVGLAMKALGYTPLHCWNGNIYRIYDLKPDEQQSNMQAMQDVYMTDNQSDAKEQRLPFWP